MCCPPFNYPVVLPEPNEISGLRFATTVGKFSYPSMDVQPFFPSWTLTNDGWVPPVPFPDTPHDYGDCWRWDEPTVSWVPCNEPPAVTADVVVDQVVTPKRARAKKTAPTA